MGFIYLVSFGRNFHKYFLFLEQNRAVDTEPTEELPKKSLNSVGSFKNSVSEKTLPFQFSLSSSSLVLAISLK